MDPWPHQVRAVQNSEEAEQHHKRICITIPTGGGKTFVAANKIHNWMADNHKIAIYTNRRALIKQLDRMMSDDYGIPHGVRCAKYPEEFDLPVQICSIQTEVSRMKKAIKAGGVWELHPATRVLVDEAHLNAGPEMLKIMQWHIDRGAIIVGLTATPLDISHAYDCLIQEGKTSELRECKALLPALVFAPDEPDFAKFKRDRKKLRDAMNDEFKMAATMEEFSDIQARQLIMTPTIMGRVWEWYEKLNPDFHPTILFAPDVAGSKWFAEQFEAKGIRAAHIGATEIYVDGDRHVKTDKRVDQLLADSEAGKLPVLCNRFVLREGIDAPWLRHCILATIFGSFSTCIQSIGRILRYYPGVKHKIIQDHGANYLRWGSPNEDRIWSLDYTDKMMRARRIDRLRSRLDTEPIVCPVCRLVLICGRCKNCGWHAENWTKSRAVVSTDGKLRLMHGDVFRPHHICDAAWGPSKWKRIFWASYKHKKTRSFRNAAILFAQDSMWQWPDPTWPLMPIYEEDWYRACADVPLSRLIQPEGGFERGEDSRGGGKAGEGKQAEPSGGLFREWESEGYYDTQETS